jgi:hypothetical protein
MKATAFFTPQSMRRVLQMMGALHFVSLALAPRLHTSIAPWRPQRMDLMRQEPSHGILVISVIVALILLGIMIDQSAWS